MQTFRALFRTPDGKIVGQWVRAQSVDHIIDATIMVNRLLGRSWELVGCKLLG